MNKQMKKVTSRNYLTDNYWKRTVGYCLVVFSSLVLGGSFAIPLNGADLFLMLKPRWEIAVSFGYAIGTAAFFIAGYVSVYTKRTINRGYKIITVLDCFLFICMCFVCLNYINDKNVSYILIVDGVLSLSGLLFYCRLDSKQLEFVRYELLWPSLYVIAVSAFVGHTLSLCFVGKINNIMFLIPLLLILLYEYILLLSDIPNLKNKKNRIGFVHGIFIVLILIFAKCDDFSKVAIYFLFFCGISMILEGLDVIKRKTDEHIRREYEAAISFAICLLAGGGSVAIALMEIIPLSYTLMLIAMIESYAFIFYGVWRWEYCSTFWIDFIKLSAFLISIVLIIILEILEINWQEVVGNVINLSKAPGIVYTVIAVFAAIVGRKFWAAFWGEHEKLSKIWKDIINVKKFYDTGKLFTYLSIAFLVGTFVLNLSFWAEEKKEKLQIVILLMGALAVINVIASIITDNVGGDEDGKKESKEESDTV